MDTTNENMLMEKFFRLSRAMRRRPAGDRPPSHGAHRILQVVQATGGIRTTDLAEAIGIRPASMTDALRRLEEEGYIRREKDEADSRVIKVYATDKTLNRRKEWAEASQEQNRRMLESLTEEEIETFCAVCDKLIAFWEAENPQPPHGPGQGRGHGPFEGHGHGHGPHRERWQARHGEGHPHMGGRHGHGKGCGECPFLRRARAE